MARIVRSENGGRRARVKVVSRQITVRFKPSEKFLEKVKKRRNSAKILQAETGRKAADQAPDHPQEKAAADLSPAPRARGEEGLKLPRLSAYFEDPIDAEPPPPSRSADDLKSIRDRLRAPQPARRSAYDELRERLRKK